MKAQQQGFTLLEVLISVFIFGIGLLGLANLQLLGQRYNHSAYLRSQAALQVYNMIDRMRANPVALAAGEYNSIDGSSVPSVPDNLCDSTPCNAVQMATVDRYEWIVQTAALLPGGVGTVSFDNTTNTFTIAVTWDDDRDGAVDSTDPEFSLEIRP